MVENDALQNNFTIAVRTQYAAIFSHFYFARNKSSDTIFKTLLPSFQTIFIFSFGERSTIDSNQNTKIEIDRCFVLGTIKQAFEYSLSPNPKLYIKVQPTFRAAKSRLLKR